MGVRMRGFDIATSAKRQVADSAVRAEAKAVIERWGCGASRAIDLRKVDRHPLASVGTVVLGLRCSWCPGSAPMPKLLGLHALPLQAAAVSSKL